MYHLVAEPAIKSPQNGTAIKISAGAAILMVVVGLITACDGAGGPTHPTSKDVTSDKVYWGGYPPGGEFVVQQDVYILSSNGQQPELLEPGLKDTGLEFPDYTKVESPKLSDYRASPARWPYLMGVLAKGSQIRIQKLEMYYSTEFYRLEVHAKVLSGDFKGKDVEIQRISFAPGEGPALGPNPEILKPADNAKKP